MFAAAADSLIVFEARVKSALGVKTRLSALNTVPLLIVIEVVPPTDRICFCAEAARVPATRTAKSIFFFI
jgi:hypothetical protein